MYPTVHLCNTTTRSYQQYSPIWILRHSVCTQHARLLPYTTFVSPTSSSSLNPPSPSPRLKIKCLVQCIDWVNCQDCTRMNDYGYKWNDTDRGTIQVLGQNSAMILTGEQYKYWHKTVQWYWQGNNTSTGTKQCNDTHRGTIQVLAQNSAMILTGEQYKYWHKTMQWYWQGNNISPGRTQCNDTDRGTIQVLAQNSAYDAVVLSLSLLRAVQR
jgi:hypothetical protein